MIIIRVYLRELFVITKCYEIMSIIIITLILSFCCYILKCQIQTSAMLSMSRCLRGGLAAEYFCKCLKERGTNSYFGVQTESLKSLTSYAPQIADHHILCSNEGSATAMAAGHYLATGAIPCVYFGNAGLGNAATPLLSLTHKDADRIPMLVVVAWRGIPDTQDYPQHEILGRHTQNLLTVMGQPFSILGEGEDPEFSLEIILDKAYSHFSVMRCPFFILAERHAFESLETPPPVDSGMTRRAAVEHVLSLIPEADIIVSGPGGVAKDVVASRIKCGVRNRADYVAIGAREHSVALAEGIALASPEKNVFCIEYGFDVLPHIAVPKTNNLKRIIFRHAKQLGTLSVAQTLGYNVSGPAESEEEIAESIKAMFSSPGPAILEITVKEGGGGEEVINYNAKHIMKHLQKDI